MEFFKKIKLLYVFIIVVIVFSKTTDSGRKNVLNVSKVAQDPERFWPVRSSKNDDLGNTSTNNKAVLYNMNLSPIAGEPFDTEALVFTGNPETYVQIHNADGSLNGTQALCLTFYVHVTNSNQEAVLLEFFGTDYYSGFRVTYNNTKIQVNFYDGTGTLITFESDITVPANSWRLIGINFNKLWDTGDQMDVFEIISGSVTKSTFQYGSQIPSIDATGDIRLGKSFDGSCSFSGKISCFQFYPFSIIGSTQKDIGDFCVSTSLQDPNMGEETYMVNTTTVFTSASTCAPFPRMAPVTTTEATTAEVTTDPSTIAETTVATTTAGTTSVTTSVTTTTPVATTSDTTTPAATTIAATTAEVTTVPSTIAETTVATTTPGTISVTTTPEATTVETTTPAATTIAATTAEVTTVPLTIAETTVATTTPRTTTIAATTDEATTVQATVTQSMYNGPGTPMDTLVINCYRWTLHSDNSIFTSSMSTSFEASLKDCLKSCVVSGVCQGITFKTVANGMGLYECRLSSNTNSTQHMTGYQIFIMQ